MTAGLPDLVDCAQLADDEALLARVYLLGAMPRLQDLLADVRGSVVANFAFAKAASGRPGATVEVEAAPQLRCQRCLQGFAFAAAGRSELEFSSAPGQAADSEREIYAMVDGRVSLRDLAEEELLLALPIVAMHAPQSCGRPPADAAGGRTRPFAALQDLFKKT